jgi:hypothetical protein
MQSLLLEFFRFHSLKTGIWRQGDPYLISTGTECPVREFTSPMEHEDFLALIQDLRYQGNADGRKAALKKIGEIACNILGTDCLTAISSSISPLQLDLVVNPAEVAALPFEAATDTEGRPLFARDDRVVVLTRRVRHGFAETGVHWPASPRFLYAWAAPPGVGNVPSHEHEMALRSALEPWLPVQQGSSSTPDSSDVLWTLGEVTLRKLQEACRTAVEKKKPFTNVHLLAHGYPVGEAPKQHFGIALRGEDGDLHAVTPDELKNALAPLVGHTVVVTLATCDAANLTNTITSKRSIAHELHELGFPIVAASQFPLTVPGSTLMIETFYGALLAGKDVRVALHETRVALYKSQHQFGHDWASLVGYARLPEGYADHLLDVMLDSMLASLKMMQGCSDQLVTQGDQNPMAFDRVEQQLRRRIETLIEFLKGAEETGRRGVLEENLGLLGSAEKRRAELCFVRSGLGEEAHWKQRMREALKRSRAWYRQGYKCNLSHHWTGVQCLSLEAVLDGRIANPGLWYAALTAAEDDKGNKNPKQVIWALGSLAELHLLAPLAGQSSRANEATDVLAEMKTRVGAFEDRDTFPLESTERQFRRYVTWWTTANGFFPGTSDLAKGAERLLAELQGSVP